MTIRDENGWELVSHDPRRGKSVWRLFDGERMHWREDQDVDALLKQNAQDRAHAPRKWGEGQRTASVPLNLFFAHLADAQTQGDDRYIQRWLADNSAFRTR